MPEVTGHVAKLKSRLANPVEYQLPLDDDHIPLNELLGQTLHLHFNGIIHCIACGRKIKKSYQQGYCFPCTQRLAACDFCILQPSKCHFHKGTCREPEWAQSHCFQDHIIYLSFTSGVKVGLTRHTQVPTRWIDQGAVAALPMLQVKSRYQAGLIEDTIAAHVADKTNWRKMLRAQEDVLDLAAKKQELLDICQDELQAINRRFPDEDVVQLVEPVQLIDYPVSEYPEKIVSLNLDKQPEISGTLLGIKGQYLFFDCGVINIRKYTGYMLQLKY